MISKDDFENLAAILRRDSLKAHLKQGGFYKEGKTFQIIFVISKSREDKAARRLPAQLAHSLA